MRKIELLDIVAPLAPPPAPPPYGWITVGTGFAILIVVGVLYFAWRRNRMRRAALAQLRRTEHALRDQRIDARVAAFQIHSALQYVHGQAFGKISVDWAELGRALDHARFAAQLPSVTNSAQLLDRARKLLRTQC